MSSKITNSRQQWIVKEKPFCKLCEMMGKSNSSSKREEFTREKCRNTDRFQYSYSFEYWNLCVLCLNVITIFYSDKGLLYEKALKVTQFPEEYFKVKKSKEDWLFCYKKKLITKKYIYVLYF
jgi:hypothetical protein